MKVIFSRMSEKEVYDEWCCVQRMMQYRYIGPTDNGNATGFMVPNCDGRDDADKNEECNSKYNRIRLNVELGL